MYTIEKYVPIYDAPGGSIDSFDVIFEDVLEPGDEGYVPPKVIHSCACYRHPDYGWVISEEEFYRIMDSMKPPF